MHPKAVLWKIEINFVWSCAFKFSVKTHFNVLKTDRYFLTFLSKWALPHNKA